MIGIIIFAYGGPTSMDDLLDYYTHIHHGKAPSEERIEAVKEKYRHVGEANQLGSMTRRQALALEHALQPCFEEQVKSYVAFKHTPPFVRETVEKMVADGVEKIITFPIKPLYSKMGIRYYQRQVRKTLNMLGCDMPIVDVEHWHQQEDFIRILAQRVQEALDWLPKDEFQASSVIFTAHSQPGLAKTHEIYIQQFSELAKLVAEQLHVPDWEIAYRSAGEKKELWLGPDVKDVIREKASQGIKAVVTCDLLSVTTNLEALYDIGFDLQEQCREWNIELVRTAFLDDAYDFIQALKKVVLQKVTAEAKDWLRPNVI
ncbi:ferrochelatase [Bacillus thermophilus]|uniref:Ferrochelatase n=1 Tax=Siminovitchia thermophila TaxID=1245522 RepID=A0ABS2R7W1_9BACI|nr:ferrochelatase [Siminovitchia thermophila]MBM7714676.1 ferrochelatase [Siminovitchia thermophila]ONK22713.1 ferrochelatase [Bacillus sp. VT-16-64]